MSETNTQNACPCGDGYKGCVDAGDGTCIACGEPLHILELKGQLEVSESARINAIKERDAYVEDSRKAWEYITQLSVLLGCNDGDTTPEQRIEELNKTVELYATAARVIALHLERFCDESLPYDQMIADAARKASSALSELREAHGGAVIAQSEAVNRMEAAEAQFQKAKEWNALSELELKNLRSRLDEAEEDMGIQGVRMGEAQDTIYALKNALRELCEKMEAGISGEDETKRARALLEKLK